MKQFYAIIAFIALSIVGANAEAAAPQAEIGLPERVYYSPEASIVVPIGTPLTFTDASTGSPTSREWQFPGSATPQSSEANPTVVYIEEGTYDITLEVSNDAGTSTTHIYNVKAGGQSLAWNITADERADLDIIDLGWYGNYAGSNWLDMDAFAERFEAPASPLTIESVNVYFGSVEAISADAPITVSVALADADGMPGEALASSTLTASQLVDGSDAKDRATVFTLDQPVEVDTTFFITIEGFPNEANAKGSDNIAVYAVRRGENERNSAYQLVKEWDDNWLPTGESNWYAQTDDPTSIAIAPNISFRNGDSGVGGIVADTSQDSPATYYNLQGIRLGGERPTAPGIYIARKGATSIKILVR